MSPASRADAPDLDALAELARIQLAPDEKKALGGELERIVDYLSKIRSDAPPRAATTEEETKGPEAAEALARPLRAIPELARQASGPSGLRDDEPAASADLEGVRRNFPKTDGARVKVPKSLE